MTLTTVVYRSIYNHNYNHNVLIPGLITEMFKDKQTSSPLKYFIDKHTLVIKDNELSAAFLRLMKKLSVSTQRQWHSRGVQLKLWGGNTCDRQTRSKDFRTWTYIIWGIFNRKAAKHFVIGLAHGGRKQQVGGWGHFKYFFAGMELLQVKSHTAYSTHLSCTCMISYTHNTLLTHIHTHNVPRPSGLCEYEEPHIH